MKKNTFNRNSTFAHDEKAKLSEIRKEQRGVSGTFAAIKTLELPNSSEIKAIDFCYTNTKRISFTEHLMSCQTSIEVHFKSRKTAKTFSEQLKALKRENAGDIVHFQYYLKPPKDRASISLENNGKNVMASIRKCETTALLDFLNKTLGPVSSSSKLDSTLLEKGCAFMCEANQEVFNAEREEFREKNRQFLNN